ncbi:MAG: hypothetical protein J7647_10155 [Cyanobacteria bacterium SBLK]|nr:hypothetical protein [Cyanobacteria bacterium SBLK]
MNINLDVETRKFLQSGNYSLYVFKGINSQPKAKNTVWLKRTGDRELYYQNQVQISWEQQYYIGETLTEPKAGAILPPGIDIERLRDLEVVSDVSLYTSTFDIRAIELRSSSRDEEISTVSGLSPYISTSNIRRIELGKTYRYEGINWNPNPSRSRNPSAVEIVNVPKLVNYFYVAQPVRDSPGYYDYIGVLELPGKESVASIEIVENIALLFSNQSLQEGEVVLDAPAKGLIVAAEKGKTISISYNENTGWNGPSGSTCALKAGVSIYEQLVACY